MAVIRTAESFTHGGAQLAGAALLCGVACSVLVLKFKGFSASLDLQSRRGDAHDAPAVSSPGVYRPYVNERYANGSSTSIYKTISPAAVQLPGASGRRTPSPPPPPLPTTPPPLPVSPSTVTFQDSVISHDPRGASVERVKSTDLKITDKETKPKLSKKEQRVADKAEKERIKEQRKKDKIIIAEILKEDLERTSREAKLLKQRQQDMKRSKSKNKNKPEQQKQKEGQSKANKSENPLAQGHSATSTDTLQSGFSQSSGPPPYSTADRKPLSDAMPSQSDSSGNTSFGKPVDNSGGTWDMVSQHRQQMRRPVQEPVTTVKVDNTHYNVSGNRYNSSGIKVEQPRKSLYV